MIDLAKEMIAGTEKTVSQIAYELGFQYSQHFNRIFKKECRIHTRRIQKATNIKVAVQIVLMKKKILNIDTVHQCNCCMGHKTLHPLVSVIDLSKAPLEQRTVRCDFYTITLIEGEAEYLTYGRKYYDYSNASLIFRIPGETMKAGHRQYACPERLVIGLSSGPDSMYNTGKPHQRLFILLL